MRDFIPPRRFFSLCAAVFGLSGVALGAVAAHAVADPHAAARLATASLYALVHAAVLLGWRAEGALSSAVRSLMVVGVFLFSGSLTLTYLAGFAAASAAPVGGTLLLAAWAGLLLAEIRGK